MIFLQAAARRESPAGACLALAEQGLVGLYVSPVILAEVRDVLERPSIRAKFRQLSDEVVGKFVARIEQVATVVEDRAAGVSLERDPKDEPYLNLAFACRANYLVSRDRDLLEGATAIAGASMPGLRIVDPVAFLIAVRQLLAASGSQYRTQ